MDQLSVTTIITQKEMSVEFFAGAQNKRHLPLLVDFALLTEK